MSAASQSNLLVDVLNIIFQKLEGEDLVNCEAVCRQWRDILLAGTPWRRHLHRKVACSPFWCGTLKKLEKNQLTLPTDQYRDVCRKIIQVAQNWRVGRLAKWTHHPGDQNSGFNLTMSDDYVAWVFERTENGRRDRGCAFLDTESMEITEFPSVFVCPAFNEMLVLWTDFRTRSAVEVRDPQNNWTVNVTNEEWPHSDSHQISFGGKLLVCYSVSRDDQEGIRIWKMGNPPTLLKTRTFEDRNLEILKVDEHFIVVSQFDLRELSKPRTLNFISTETLDVFTSLSEMRDWRYEYNRGLLFQSRDNVIIRILDLATGTYINDVHLPFRKEEERSVRLLDTWASSNSNVLVIGWKYLNKIVSNRLSQLSVYDLKAVKNLNSDPDSHLLYTLQFQIGMEDFVMNETEIAFNGHDGNYNRSVTVLKFVNFNFDSDLNPEDNEHVKMRIVRDPCV